MSRQYIDPNKAVPSNNSSSHAVDNNDHGMIDTHMVAHVGQNMSALTHQLSQGIHAGVMNIVQDGQDHILSNHQANIQHHQQNIYMRGVDQSYGTHMSAAPIGYQIADGTYIDQHSMENHLHQELSDHIHPKHHS